MPIRSLAEQHPDLIYEENSEKRIKDSPFVALIEDHSLPDLSELSGQTIYDRLSDFLRTTNDAQFGIKSYLNDEGEWVRDATNAVPLQDRISHEAPAIEANNALLRCLSRLKAIDYAIDKKMGYLGEGLRLGLKAEFEHTALTTLFHANAEIPNAEKLQRIKALEEKFNASLIKHLHEANLTKDCNTKEDAEKLLAHYRNLSSLMQPARTLVTLTYDEKAEIFQRETQYPVTKKTASQHEALNKLKGITPYPFKDEKNSHTAGNIAAQEADNLFSDLMNDDARSLPAQARKTHLVGAKNAFIVKNELIPLRAGQTLEDVRQNKAAAEDTLWLARAGVPVFVGSGESSEEIQKHTKENLEQIRQKARELMGGDEHLSIHVTCLNTYTPLENQATMIDHLYEATRHQKKGDDISYMPTNPDGTFRRLNIAPSLSNPEETVPSGMAPLQKTTRLQSVGKIILQAAKKANLLSLVQCASGQDRTGTAVEHSTQEWMKQRYIEKNLSTANIETMRAAGGNAAEIASHLLPGSPGMKKESMANNTFGGGRAFSKKASEQLYLRSANTNKKNEVNSEKIAFLTKPSQAALDEFNYELERFKINLDAKAIKEDKKKQALYEQGQSTLKNINTIVANDPSELDAQSLMQLTMVLSNCTTLLKNQDPSLAENQQAVRRLASLSQEVPGKKSAAWKALGAGLISFTCLAIGVLGVLAIIPTGGSSLLLAAIAATGLSVGGAGAIAVTGATAVTATAVTGLGVYSSGQEKGLAKSVKKFKTSYVDLVTDNKTEKESQESPNPNEAPHK